MNSPFEVGSASAPPGSLIVKPKALGEPETRRLAIARLPDQNGSLSPLRVGVELDAFLDDLTRRHFVDGKADCALTIADWAMVATGCADPAAHLRGRYSTALGRERVLRRLGGLEAVIADCATRAGLFETANPVRGDVGLIRVGRQELAAIFLGQRWAIKSSEGLTVYPADDVLRAWSVPHG